MASVPDPSKASGAGNGAGEEPRGMEAEADLLSALAEIPSVSNAWCRPTPQDGGMDLTVMYSQRNLPGNSMRKYICTYHVTSDFWESPAGPPVPSFPLELRDVGLFSPSPSGAKVFISRGGTGGTDTTLEVWGGSRLLKELKVPKKVHGAIFNDGWFSSGAAWSRDETKIAYVAEEAKANKTPEWGRSRNGSANGGEGAADAVGPAKWRGVGQHQDDWGELFTGKAAPRVFVLDLEKWTVLQVEATKQESMSFGQPTFTPSGDHLVMVMWPHKADNFPHLPERLGIVYCVNRPCYLWLAPVPATPEAASKLATPDAPPRLETPPDSPISATPEAAPILASPEAPPRLGKGSGSAASRPREVGRTLTPDHLSALSPKFSPSGDTLIFLSHEAAVQSGVHLATAALLKIPWDPVGNCARGPAEVLVPISQTASTRPGDFQGLYTNGLLTQPFLEDGDEDMVVVNTQSRSYSEYVKVWLDDGEVMSMDAGELKGDSCDGSCTFLTSCPGWHVASFSAPNKANTIWVKQNFLDSDRVGQTSGWKLIGPADGGVPFPPLAEEALSRISYDVLQVQPQTAPLDLPFEVVVVRGSEGPAPAILFPHGGPHSAYPASYMLGLAFLAGLGYIVLAVNFRGSTGFGEDSIQSLPGNIGVNDVSDCIAALDAAIAKGWVDESQVAVVGGSHGGFLAGHLVGQHPTRFRAAALRNPVLDISLMVHVSDIPDWTFIETWGTEEGRKRATIKPTTEDLDRFRQMSPIAHIDKVTAPLLFMLGAKDRRVPQVDAHRYVAALRQRTDAPPTSIFVFPEDTHALDKPQTEYEQWLNIAAWLKKYM